MRSCWLLATRERSPSSSAAGRRDSMVLRSTPCASSLERIPYSAVRPRRSNSRTRRTALYYSWESYLCNKVIQSVWIRPCECGMKQLSVMFGLIWHSNAISRNDLEINLHSISRKIKFDMTTLRQCNETISKMFTNAKRIKYW